MKMTEFIGHFIEVFDEVPAIEVTPETRHHEMEKWSSLIALSVMAMIDEEYDVEISADEMRNSQTVQELFDIGKRHLDE